MAKLTRYNGRLTRNSMGQLTRYEASAVVPDTINYGLLYNWYATQEQSIGVWLVGDAMRSDGWHIYEKDDMQNLFEIISSSPIISDYFMYANDGGRNIKDNSNDYWAIGLEGTNELKYFLRGGGQRTNLGVFEKLKETAYIWSGWVGRNNWYYYIETYDDDIDFTESSSSGDPKRGRSIRLCRPATAAEQLLPDGELSGVYYYGNDGKIYRVTKIGTQVWLADNLAETKWSDGSWIQGYDGGTYTPITDANWAALTTAACCAYGDDTTKI